MADSAAQLTTGAVIGGTYEVAHQIGRGGMGEVWLARHLRVPRQVAIKVLRTGGTPLTEEAKTRFRREADIVCKLGHPNIVSVEDHAFLPSGDPYLVLELLEGEPLSRRLKRGPMPIEEARSVVRQVGSALQAAHHHGVVHRDLKPDNIFLLPSPLGGLRVKVLDFGISKIQDSSTLQTQEAVLVGTPQYMSPEQATGSNKDVGPQSDVFALGSIAYEMLSGQAAFKGESIAQLVFRVAYEKHPPLAPLVAPDVPATAVAAVERALLKERAQRTTDVATFVLEFTGETITLTSSAGVAPAPQLAVVATPSLQMSASLGVADTAAPGSQPAGKLPTPPPGEVARAATPQVPSLPTGASPPPPPPSATSVAAGPPAPSAAATTSASTGRRYRPIWVSAGTAAALLLALAAGYQLTGARQAEPLALSAPLGVEAGSQRPATTSTEAVIPSTPPVPEEGKTQPEPSPGKPQPLPVVKEASPEPAKDAPARPLRRLRRKEVTPEERARIKDLKAAANPEGNQKVDLRQLIRQWERATEGITGAMALDLMTAEVAKAMCREGDSRYFAWRDRIETPQVKAQVESACER